MFRIPRCRFCNDRGCVVCPPVPEHNPIVTIINTDDIEKLKPALHADALKERADRLGVNTPEFIEETLSLLRKAQADIDAEGSEEAAQ